MKSLWKEVARYRTYIYSEEEKNKQRQKLLIALKNAKANGETLTLSALCERYSLTSQVILARINSDSELKTLWEEVRTRDRIIFTKEQISEHTTQIREIISNAINNGIKLTQTQIAEQMGISQWSVSERINSNPELLKLWNEMGK